MRCASQPAVVRMQRPTRGAADAGHKERKQDLKTKSVEHTNICIALEPEGAIAVKQDEEEIKLAADSGATDTVIPLGLAQQSIERVSTLQAWP